MKSLVLIGSGHGELDALPILVRKLLQERQQAQNLLSVDDSVFRVTDAAGLVTTDRTTKRPDCSKWIQRIRRAARRENLGGILAIFDGDAPAFPAGSSEAFCAKKAAKYMAEAASEVGAGKLFSLAIVFACVEYETWLVAGIESLSGNKLADGRIAMPPGLKFPDGPNESHGKRWLGKNRDGYRPTRDQGPFTELLDLNEVRSRGLRSFRRLDDAVDELLQAATTGTQILTPL